MFDIGEASILPLADSLVFLRYVIICVSVPLIDFFPEPAPALECSTSEKFLPSLADFLVFKLTDNFVHGCVCLSIVILILALCIKHVRTNRPVVTLLPFYLVGGLRDLITCVDPFMIHREENLPDDPAVLESSDLVPLGPATAFFSARRGGEKGEGAGRERAAAEAACYDFTVSMPVAAVRPATLTLVSFSLFLLVMLADAMRSLDVSHVT